MFILPCQILQQQIDGKVWSVAHGDPLRLRCQFLLRHLIQQSPDLAEDSRRQEITMIQLLVLNDLPPLNHQSWQELLLIRQLQCEGHVYEVIPAGSVIHRS